MTNEQQNQSGETEKNQPQVQVLTRDASVCNTCGASARWLCQMECPLLASDTMGESDGTVCWLCKGEGEIEICAWCFYLGPDRKGTYGESGK